jgi:hypothetical protein
MYIKLKMSFKIPQLFSVGWFIPLIINLNGAFSLCIFGLPFTEPWLTFRGSMYFYVIWGVIFFPLTIGSSVLRFTLLNTLWHLQTFLVEYEGNFNLMSLW